MAEPPFEPGGGFDAGYRIERELGRGGMATVWLAHDLKHDRPVALKVLLPEVAAALGPERFQREIKLAARLQHPHILSVYDSGAAPRPGGAEGGRGEALWYTMPYVEGESLRERLRRVGRLPAPEAVRIAREVAQALQYAHEHGVVHRDIKPENILLTADGNTLVADFGIARPLDVEAGRGLTATGFVLGTPSYMSPEQATGETAVDGRSDVYSLGCVLYEMLSGVPPFSGPTVAAVLGKQLTRAAPPLPRGSAPEPVARAVARALAKSPAERYASAAEFAAALQPAERAPSPGRRGLRRALPVALAGLGLLGLTYYAGTRALPARSALGTGAVASGFNRKLAQLTFGEGVEESPAWSPDGKTLAYVGEAEGYKQLFLRTLPAGPERRLTRGPKDDIQPAWSPDGKRLAFVRAKTDRGKLEPSDINGWYFEGGEIWVLDLESGRQQKLVADAFHPAYSPEGTRLAFDAPWAGPRRIWIADAGGRNPRQITSDSSEAVVHTEPRWSPDGRKLVFRRIEKTTSDIVVVDPASSRMVRITNDNVQDLDPVWSPDGRYVYFASYRGGGLNIWRLAVTPSGEAAGAPEQLTTGAGDDLEPTLAPDGRRLAFAVRGIHSDLWRLPVSPETGRAAGDPEPVLATSRVESRGSWSPDGRTIAFNSDRLGEMNLWLRNLADGTERQVTTGPGGDYQPEWSPDGRSLVFFSARAGNADVWAVRLADGRLTRLTDSPGMDINPFYSPDGRRIAFLSDRSGRSEVWLMNADGSGQRQLTSVGAGGHFLLWMPDGRGLIFRAESGTEMRIYRADIEDGTLTRLPDVASGAHMTFSPDRSRILDVRGHKSLWVYPLTGAPPYQVFEFADPDVRIDYPVWSPDGRSVLFDRAAPRGGDLWVLEGIE